MKDYKKPVLNEEKIEIEDIIAGSPFGTDGNSINGHMWDSDKYGSQDN